MLLHRYFGSHAFETLKDRKLKTSRLSDFNDPFEFMFVYTSSMTDGQAENYIFARCNDPEFLAWAKRQLPNVSDADIKEHLRKFTPERIADVAANFGKGCE